MRIIEESGELRSSIACHVCRKRKIKCGRELPRCLVCEQSGQICEFPERVLKPGPRIGASQKTRKRAHPSNDDESSRSPGRKRQSHPSPPVEFERASNPQQSAQSTAQTQLIPPAADLVRKPSQDIQRLSFIMHPSHESCPTEEEQVQAWTPTRTEPSNEEPLLTASSYALGITPDVLNRLINEYFENFTSFQLFREPYFRAKLQHIESGLQINALLAAMLSFAAKMSDKSSESGLDISGVDSSGQLSHNYFIDLAMKNVDEAIAECGDEPPPLCLLQALILTTHWLLIQGVRGRAWRYLGTCVRIAYELNLHLVDSTTPVNGTVQDSIRWCEDEERRRVWWSIWEMDVFASVIRRCPTAIDWSQNETYLPVEDKHWYEANPQPSCFLEPGLTDRWKALQASGNEAPKAWFIVINSWMKEAQNVSSPTAVNKGSRSEGSWTPSDRRPSSARRWIGDRAYHRLHTLYNSLRCFVMALPPALRYRNQYLSFDPRPASQTDRATSPRQLHSAIYSIHLMTQLAKLMIHHWHVFGKAATAARYSADRTNGQEATDEAHPSHKYTELYHSNRKRATDEYFEAAYEILTVVHRSSDNHYRYVNPFLANTVWLAAAVELVHGEFVIEGLDKDVVKSSFDVLCLTYKRFVDFWRMSTALQQNLDTLGSQLASFRANAQDNFNYARLSNEQSRRVNSDRLSNRETPNKSREARKENRAGHKGEQHMFNRGWSILNGVAADRYRSYQPNRTQSNGETSSGGEDSRLVDPIPRTSLNTTQQQQQLPRSDQHMPIQAQQPQQESQQQDHQYYQQQQPHQQDHTQQQPPRHQQDQPQQQQQEPSAYNGPISPSLSSLSSMSIQPTMLSQPILDRPLLEQWGPFGAYFPGLEPHTITTPDLMEGSGYSRQLAGGNMELSIFLDELLSCSNLEQ